MSSSGKGVAIRLSVEGAEQVKAALVRLGDEGKAALARLNFDTASGGASIFEHALEELRSGASELTGSLGGVGNVLMGVGGGYLAAGAAAGAFLELVKKSVEAAEEEEQAQRRVAAVLLATGGASGQTSASIEEMASKISRSTLQTKEDVENAAAQLATFRNIGPDAFERTLQAAADMSAVFGGDLSSNVMKLGLALDDPINGMNRLRRSGLDLSPAQKEVIENLQRTGDIAGAQGKLLDALAAKLGGAGASQADGLTGAAHRFGIEWHDTMVQLGESSGIIDALAKSFDGLADAMHHARESRPRVDQYGIPTGPAEADFINSYYDNRAQNGGHPVQVSHEDANAMLGPGRAALERQEELAQALDQSIRQLNQEASVVGDRQRFINSKLEEIAKANETTIAGLQSQQPGKYAQLVSAAGKDYDSQHSEKNANKLAEEVQKWTEQATREMEQASKAFGDQQKEMADLSLAQVNAANQLRATTDALLVHQLEGQTGYFEALKHANDDWLADRLAAIQAEEDKAVADLDMKAQQYQKDGIAYATYEQDKTLIAKTAATQRAQAEAEARSKQQDLEDAQEGPLHPLIDKGNRDWNQSLKGVAADGLNSLESGLLGVESGTENVLKAFDKMTAGILQDLAKIVIEKQIIGPLGNWLNGAIDGSNSGSFLSGLFGSANGNVFDSGNVMPFANGGIVDGPTVVPMALMGEAGPEAILPLARGSNGKLGLAAPGGGGEVHNHFSPTIVLQGGASDDQIAALNERMNKFQNEFFTNSVNAYAQMKSRRIAK